MDEGYVTQLNIFLLLTFSGVIFTIDIYNAETMILALDNRQKLLTIFLSFHLVLIRILKE